MSSPTNSKKARKPYTISKPRESWSTDEHQLFIEALNLYERDWKRIAQHIQTKSIIQIRSHAQKYFIKMQKSGMKQAIPPPRVKRTNEAVSHQSHSHKGTKKGKRNSTSNANGSESEESEENEENENSNNDEREREGDSEETTKGNHSHGVHHSSADKERDRENSREKESSKESSRERSLSGSGSGSLNNRRNSHNSVGRPRRKKKKMYDDEDIEENEEEEEEEEENLNQQYTTNNNNNNHWNDEENDVEEDSRPVHSQRNGGNNHNQGRNYSVHNSQNNNTNNYPNSNRRQSLGYSGSREDYHKSNSGSSNYNNQTSSNSVRGSNPNLQLVGLHDLETPSTALRNISHQMVYTDMSPLTALTRISNVMIPNSTNPADDGFAPDFLPPPVTTVPSNSVTMIPSISVPPNQPSNMNNASSREISSATLTGTSSLTNSLMSSSNNQSSAASTPASLSKASSNTSNNNPSNGILSSLAQPPSTDSDLATVYSFLSGIFDPSLNKDMVTEMDAMSDGAKTMVHKLMISLAGNLSNPQAVMDSLRKLQEQDYPKSTYSFDKKETKQEDSKQNLSNNNSHAAPNGSKSLDDKENPPVSISPASNITSNSIANTTQLQNDQESNTTSRMSIHDSTESFHNDTNRPLVEESTSHRRDSISSIHYPMQSHHFIKEDNSGNIPGSENSFNRKPSIYGNRVLSLTSQHLQGPLNSFTPPQPSLLPSSQPYPLSLSSSNSGSVSSGSMGRSSSLLSNNSYLDSGHHPLLQNPVLHLSPSSNPANNNNSIGGSMSNLQLTPSRSSQLLNSQRTLSNSSNPPPLRNPIKTNSFSGASNNPNPSNPSYFSNGNSNSNTSLGNNNSNIPIQSSMPQSQPQPQSQLQHHQQPPSSHSQLQQQSHSQSAQSVPPTHPPPPPPPHPSSSSSLPPQAPSQPMFQSQAPFPQRMNPNHSQLGLNNTNANGANAIMAPYYPSNNNPIPLVVPPANPNTNPYSNYPVQNVPFNRIPSHPNHNNNLNVNNTTPSNSNNYFNNYPQGAGHNMSNNNPNMNNPGYSNRVPSNGNLNMNAPAPSPAHAHTPGAPSSNLAPGPSGPVVPGGTQSGAPLNSMSMSMGPSINTPGPGSGSNSLTINGMPPHNSMQPLHLSPPV